MVAILVNQPAAYIEFLDIVNEFTPGSSTIGTGTTSTRARDDAQRLHSVGLRKCFEQEIAEDAENTKGRANSIPTPAFPAFSH